MHSPSAEKVDWNQEGDHYFVHFKDHEVTFLKSNMIMTAISWLQKGIIRMPTCCLCSLSWELHKKFSDKTVYGITETNTETETYYYVKLQDAKGMDNRKRCFRWYLEVVERFNKQ